MVADTSSSSPVVSYGTYGEGDETFLRRAGTSAQRRHTRKATQLAADAAAMSAMMPPLPPPMPGTPASTTTTTMTTSDFDFRDDVSSLDMGRSPTSSITTADERSLDSITSQSLSQAFDMDNFTVPPLPQPHIPLRKTSASNLRQIAVSNSFDHHANSDVESPRRSRFPDRRSSRLNSPRLPKDKQDQEHGASHVEEISPKEEVKVGPVPRGRSRGMTTVGGRPLGEAGSQFRSPSIPDMRGAARAPAHVSSTYKPERGPGSKDQSLPFRNPPPPVPWKDGEEARSSFRSALTNGSYVTYTSSGYYEPSEAERSSVATRSSSYSNDSHHNQSAADDDDFDACDYIDLYAGGFMDDEEKSQRSARNSLRRIAARSSAVPSARLSLSDPAIQSPLSPYDDEVRPSSIQHPCSPALALSSRPSSVQNPLGIEVETNNAPTKYDSKFDHDDDDVVIPKSPALPHSPALTQSSPNSPALLSHPVNPAAPPSPLSPFPPTLKTDDPYVSPPVSPLSRMDISPLDAPAYQPSPLDADAAGFFPPMKPVATAIPVVQPAPSAKSSISDQAGAPRDRYGFKKANHYVTVEQYDTWNAGYTNYLQRRKTKWEIMMIQWGLPINNPTRFPPRSDKVKRYIRKGIPPDWRGDCWFWYAGGPARLAANPGLYERRLREAEEGKLSDYDRDAIEKDLNRTFPDNLEYKPDHITGDNSSSSSEEEEVPIIKALRRVLQAFAVDNPSIGYCQSLNFLAGLPLLFLKDEEKTFHLLNILCNVHLPGIHGKVLEATVDTGVLMSCIKDLLPQVWNKIDDNKDNNQRGGPLLTMHMPDVSFATTNWFMCCFVGIMPLESVLRVWDCFFYEGSKTLFRIALAIFKLGEADIRRVEDLEVIQVVQGIPRRLLDINGLMESCYKRRNGFGHLSQDVIDARRKERRAALQKERDLKNGQVSPHVLQEMQRPPSRGRLGTLSRAASRARGLSRARSRKREAAAAAEEPMPPTPTQAMLGAKF